MPSDLDRLHESSEASENLSDTNEDQSHCKLIHEKTKGITIELSKTKTMTASPASSGKKVAPNQKSAAVSSSTTSTHGNAMVASTNSTATKPSAEASPKKMRKWQVFPGRNKFMCDGRLIMARQTGILYFTIILILITVALFFSFECRLTLVALPYGFLIPLIGGLLFVFNMGCLLRTAWSDPGIIPRAKPEEAAYIEKLMAAQQTARDEGTGYRPPPRSCDITLKGNNIKLKYCFSCKIFRPPRASHCSLCDNCVENFDHHCPWVGNCVGRRNYRYFFLFISSLTILCLYIFVFAIVNIVLLANQSDGGFLDALKTSPGSVLEILVCFFSIWSVIGLSGFHSYLIVQSLTTNEDIKGTWSKKRNPNNTNPFDQGSWFKNCYFVLCTPTPPSYIDRRGWVDQDDIKTSENKSNGKPTSGFGGGRQESFTIDMETYDTDGALYPRQPQPINQQQTNNKVTTNHNNKQQKTATSTENHQQLPSEIPAMDEVATDDDDDDTPAVTISHYSTMELMNDNSSSLMIKHNNDDDDTVSIGSSQPSVIIQHLPPPTETTMLDTTVSVLDSTTLSNDSKTLLLLKDHKSGGSGDHLSEVSSDASSAPKISSV